MSTFRLIVSVALYQLLILVAPRGELARLGKGLVVYGKYGREAFVLYCKQIANGDKWSS